MSADVIAWVGFANGILAGIGISLIVAGIRDWSRR